ncbi:MAG: chemotaxis protein CheW [Victivallales bacterium]|nr:chemotaxis protein CheW [Victivallales bacterium]
MVENAVSDSKSSKGLVAKSDPGGKYLTFVLGDEVFGIQITKVQEIIRMQNVTKVPRVKPFVRGVINLRGKIIPVIELRTKFNMDKQDDTDKTCIIVIQVEGEVVSCTMGVIIDEVREVLNISSEAIEPPTVLGYSESNDFMLGIGKIGDEVKILLNIDKILTSSELAMLAEM